MRVGAAWSGVGKFRNNMKVRQQEINLVDDGLLCACIIVCHESSSRNIPCIGLVQIYYGT